jgi:hypothetical protein
MASDGGHRVVHLDELVRTGTKNEWIPIRRELDILAFGINAWSLDEPGVDVVNEHDELQTGHEELYVVVEGHATFVVGGEEVDAPKGTILFVRDPAVKRAARVTSGRTTVLTVGAKPGEAFTVSTWEKNAEVIPLFQRGEYAEAKRMLEELLAEHPGEAGPLYNLACAEARLGESDAALEHLALAVGESESLRELAASDEDLASIRADPRFPAS